VLADDGGAGLGVGGGSLVYANISVNANRTISTAVAAEITTN
jgi:hypothetical protein